MTISMASYLKVAVPHIPLPLVSLEGLSTIQALAQSLPPLSVTGFECRLGKGQSRVDFIVRSPCPILNLPEVFLTHSTWQAFAQFCQDWTSRKTDLHRIVEYIWLEFDLIGKSSQVPIPCVGFTLNQKTFGDSRLREIAFEYLIKLLQPSDSLLLESKVRTCIDSLPNDARIVHIGAMLSRPDEALKLVTKGIPPEHFPDYLRQVGWQDQTNRLSTLISNISNFVDSIGLAFDVGDSIYPRIGLECFFNKQPFIDKSSWRLFLDDYLIKQGLCTPAKGKALLAWPGFSQQADHPELWPSNLNNLDLLFGAKAFSLFYRTIDLIKIIYQPDSSLSAKAYLAFVHSYCERNFLDSE